jgi:hypothetical protein
MTRECLALGAMVGSLIASACRGEPTSDPPIAVERNMYVQERVDPQSASSFFSDRAGMRPAVAGSVPMEGFEDHEAVATGVLLDGSAYVLSIPDEAVARGGGMGPFVHRGRERYEIYCAPCHGRTGDGKGIVARVPGSFPPLPTFNDPRIRRLPDGQIYATITNGVRIMPPYGAQIPVVDRWAIVAYVRALELSQLALAEGRSR